MLEEADKHYCFFQAKGEGLQPKENELIEGNWADLFLLSHRLSCFQYACKKAIQFGRMRNKLFSKQKSSPLGLKTYSNTLDIQEK